jgi:hypothetical protein
MSIKSTFPWRQAPTTVVKDEEEEDDTAASTTAYDELQTNQFVQRELGRFLGPPAKKLKR